MKKYQGPWNEEQLKHLLRRTLFGVTLEDYNYFKGKSMDQCIEILLDTSSSPIPPLYYLDRRTATIKEYQWETYISYMPESTALKSSCVHAMINQQRNIVERMVLFWHNHFATIYQMNKNAVYAYQYFLLLRQYVTGDFKKLLREMTTNVYMLMFLNGNMNNKTAPNENYARELQELFSLGKGPGSRYTEEDVHAASKVLTGWKVNDEKFSSYFDPEIHDTSDKNFSAFYGNYVIKGRNGAEGSIETDDLIDMICKQPEVSKFICRKLYRWFVHSTIDKHIESNVIEHLADIMIKSNYEIKPVLKAILSSDFFYDTKLFGGIIKSPLDFMVGIAREFKIKNDIDTRPVREFVVPFCVALVAGKMGQYIGDPPSVAGWPAYYEYPLYDQAWLSSAIFGHSVWLNSATSLDTPIPEQTDEEVTLRLDLLSFIETLSNPNDSKQWLAEAMNLLYPIPCGPSQIVHLQNLLDTGSEITGKWNEVWSKYSIGKNNPELRKEIRTRLRFTFLGLLTYPEYQIR